MKSNSIRRLITIAAALTITLAISAGGAFAGKDNGNGTITDSSGLVWLKNAGCLSSLTWDSAMSTARAIHSGDCGLTDKSTSGQWRLPTVAELTRIRGEKAGFTNVLSSYWSSEAYDAKDAWLVSMIMPFKNHVTKGDHLFVWPVRSALSGSAQCL